VSAHDRGQQAGEGVAKCRSVVRLCYAVKTRTPSWAYLNRNTRSTATRTQAPRMDITSGYQQPYAGATPSRKTPRKPLGKVTGGSGVPEPLHHRKHARLQPRHVTGCPLPVHEKPPRTFPVPNQRQAGPYRLVQPAVTTQECSGSAYPSQVYRQKRQPVRTWRQHPLSTPSRSTQGRPLCRAQSIS